MAGYVKQTWHDKPATDTPTSASRLGHIEDGIAAAHASIANMQAANNLATLIGDSIGIGGPVSGGVPYVSMSDQWLNQLCVMANQRIQFYGSFATGGYTLTNIRDTHLPTVLAMSPTPGACFIQGGANDIIASPSDGASWTLATSSSVFKDIVAQLVAKGIMPIAVTCTPAFATAHPTIRANAQKWNAWLTRYCARNGIALVNENDVLTGADGILIASLSVGDDVHPNPLGHKRIAERALIDGIHLRFPPGNEANKTVRGSNDVRNMFNSGTVNYGVIVDSNSDGFADGFAPAIGGTSTGTTVAVVPAVTGDNIHGSWQQITRVAGATGVSYVVQNTVFSTGFSVGDRIAWSAYVQTEGMDKTSTPWDILLFAIGTTDTNAALNGISQWHVDANGLMYCEFIVPAGTSSMYFAQQIEANPGTIPVKLRVAEPSIVNLTTGGLLI